AVTRAVRAQQAGEPGAAGADVHDDRLARVERRQLRAHVGEDRLLAPLAVRVGEADLLVAAERLVGREAAEVVVAQLGEAPVVLRGRAHTPVIGARGRRLRAESPTRSGAERADRDDLDAVVAYIAEPGRDDHAERRGPAAALGVDLTG